MNSHFTSKMRAGLITAVMTVVFFATASHAKAQDVRIKANVPFAFEDGLGHFTAGQYTIRTENTHFLLLQGEKTSGYVVIPAGTESRSTTTGMLIFHRYGVRYFLSEVWMPDSSTHIVLPKSRAERHALLATNGTAPSNIELAMLQIPR